MLILAKEGNQSEAATPPTAEAMAEFQKFKEELVNAGVVLKSRRLYPSSKSKRVRFDDKKRTVIDEALEWLKRAHYDGGTFEVREVVEYEGK